MEALANMERLSQFIGPHQEAMQLVEFQYLEELDSKKSKLRVDRTGSQPQNRTCASSYTMSEAVQMDVM